MLLRVFNPRESRALLQERGVREFLKAFAVHVVMCACAASVFPEFLLPEKSRRRMYARKMFYNKKLIWNPAGYWSVFPMPNAFELDEFYKNAYWEQRGGKYEGVEKRDLDHFMLLKLLIPEFFTGKSKRIVNFGAGHGGISHLLYLSGHTVINVEPSQPTLDYGDPHWQHVPALEKVEGQVDLVYGSHSLEHVRDLEGFEKSVMALLAVGGYVFWEVPNAEHPASGGSNGVIYAPHTHYFTRKYFGNSKYELLLNEAFSQRAFPNKLATEEHVVGEVIRFLGRKTELVWAVAGNSKEPPCDA